jgi:GT2 family glycosyltransferase
VTRPVSVVIPSFDDTELLERNLPPLLAEVARRALGDEVLVVDDTGRDVIAAKLAPRFPQVRVFARSENGGFARTLRSGVENAAHDLVFAMNPDVRVRSGFLDPLVACLQEDVSAVVPRVLLGGDEQRVESLTELQWKDGLVELRQRGLEPGGEEARLRMAPVAFAIGGACLFRKREFLATGGFDPLYEPFYWEDVDWGWRAWRAGKRVLYQPASVVEHHHRGTIGRLVEEELVRAAIEKNRLLFPWKHVDDPELLRAHVAALYRLALDAYALDQRDELIWLDLALEELERALASRAKQAKNARSFAELLRAARPDERATEAPAGRG